MNCGGNPADLGSGKSNDLKHFLAVNAVEVKVGIERQAASRHSRISFRNASFTASAVG